jgi:hypothetical protein
MPRQRGVRGITQIRKCEFERMRIRANIGAAKLIASINLRSQ